MSEKVLGFDMIAGLYNLPEFNIPQGVEIKRALPCDKTEVLRFVEDNFSVRWKDEADKAMVQEISKCFVAVKEGKIIGFSCFDTAAKGYFGPIGISKECRGTDVGKGLLITTLKAMKDYGYGYAIIGWVNEAENFYRKCVGAEIIKDSNPADNVYANLINVC